MKILLDNVNLKSSSGPNHFGNKIKKYLEKIDNVCDISVNNPDVQLSFIAATRYNKEIPLVQRLDGIYFDITKNHQLENYNIIETYKRAKGVIFQSEFSKNLVFKYFGPHENSVVIHNGSDLEMIDSIVPLKHEKYEKYDNIWCCASQWRGWKRLGDNVRFFLEFAGKNDCLIVAGNPSPEEIVQHERIFYIGNVEPKTLFSIFKLSKYFIHLARHDACPNVVVDARSCGCQIICCSNGGTKEISGLNAKVVQEEEWDLEPIEVNAPPSLNFETIEENYYNSNIDMKFVAKKYNDFMIGLNNK